jgi:NADP-dependent 3-hydroxy acid dehydrogenase YdfG
MAGPVGLDEHLRPRRHRDLERLAVAPVAQRALAMAAPASLEVAAPAKALEIAQGVVAHEHDVATAAPVSPVRPTLGDVGLAPEAQAAVTAAARLDEDVRAILHEKMLTCPIPTSPSPAADMADPVLLITGASTGIGAASARHAAQAGYRLVLAARSTDKLEELARDLGGAERALAVTCDVTDWDQQQAMASAARERFGRLDAVFANAGFGAPRGFTRDTVEHWRAMVLTNVLGAALTIRATIDALRETRGHLVLTGSVAGRRALPGSLYSATKWAVTGMGEAARQELNDSGVRVTLIEPGQVDTPFFDRGAGPNALTADDVARTVMFALAQPPHVDVNEILVRPTAQHD